MKVWIVYGMYAGDEVMSEIFATEELAKEWCKESKDSYIEYYIEHRVVIGE